MKQPGLIVTLIVFIAAVSFVLAAQQEKGHTFNIQLSGATELNTDGKGLLKLNLKPSQHKICYELSASNVATVSSIQVHSGGIYRVGPMVLEMKTATQDLMKGCQNLDPELAMDIIHTPENYCVTIVNAEFPHGALRGQIFR